ncbi:MAG: fatty acyl-AMP ligase [Myxococcota bacterium]
MSSILEPLFRWADRAPDTLLYAWLNCDGEIVQRFTYAEFVSRTADIAHYLLERRPLPVGSRVLLAYPPGLEVICAFFACVRLGLVPVPVYPPTRHGFQAAMARMNFIADDCGASAVLTDRTYYWSMKLSQVRHTVRTWSWSSDTVSTLPWIVSADAPRLDRPSLPDRHHALLFLQYTSGSTSSPRGVMVRHDNILVNGDAVVDHLPVGVSWLPQYHDMGLIGYYLFFAMKGGTTYGFSPMDFIRRPALWLETISRFRGTASSAPNFAYEYCLRPGKIPPETFEQLDLTSLRFLMNAAEPVRPDVFRRFLQTFSPVGLDPKSLFSAYGLAEFTLAVSNYGRRIQRFDREALLHDEARIVPADASETAAVSLVSCGRPLGETEIRIVDPHADPPQVVADGTVGEVWLRGPSRCAGYWGRPEATAATFHAPLPDGSDWLRTGDLGFFDDGELFLCGRLKDLIIVRGMNHYPQDIEVLVEQSPEVRRGCVAAFSIDGDGEETVIVLAEVRKPTALPDSHAIQTRVQRLLGVSIGVLVFIPARTIPKTSSGKLARHLARRRYLDDALTIISAVRPAVSVMPDDAGAEVVAVSGAPGVTAVLRRFGLTGQETWTLAEAGLDSIQMVDFAHALKAHLTEHGEAVLADAVDLQVLQTVALSELRGLLEQLEQATPGARLRFRRVLGRLGAEHRAREQAMMRRDAKLRFDPARLPRLENPPQGGPILLTGATGFFGPFLLASLLTQTDREIVVLVRATDDAAGKRRVFDGLQGVYPTMAPGWTERVRAVCGDLSRVNLGLTTGQWETLAEDIDVIYHNGAWVNYLFDYATMRDANVGGTNEIVRLAMSHRRKALNHISTTFVFGWSVKDTLFESDTNPDMDLLDFGYAQSKWVSEQVILDAMRQGLPARIFRPALITPSVDGAGSHFDISVRLLAFMLNHGMGTTARNQVSFSPADVTADNIVAIAQQPESLGETVHVTRDEYAHMEQITTLLGEMTDTSFAQLPLDQFVPAVIERCQPGDILFPLLDFFVRSTDNITAMEFKRYDNAQYRRFRDRSSNGRADPPLEDVVRGLLRFMRRHDLLTLPRRRHA